VVVGWTSAAQSTGIARQEGGGLRYAHPPYSLLHHERTDMDGITGKIQLSLRVPVGMVESFERIAKALERDRAWVMLRALRQYLDREGGDVLQEAEGLAALDRGEGMDFDAVMDEADGIIAQAKAERARKAG
jgi:predicted transcriptional regulator